MKVVNGSKNYRNDDYLVLAIGNFDGVHVGHKKILNETCNIAKSKGFIPTLYTFDPHPARIVAPFGAPPLILTLDQKLKMISDCGIELAIIENFTKELSQLSPIEYFEGILLPLKPKHILIGYDFTFGKNRQGNIQLLQDICNKYKIELHALEAQFMNGTLISSTIIRQLITYGLVDEANKLLGYPLSIVGKVEKGAGKGTGLGFPTANLTPENEVLPGPGVYISNTKIPNGSLLQSVTFCGPVATFQRYNYAIETHIIDKSFNDNLLNSNIEIEFLSRLREVQIFDNKDCLKKAIFNDVNEARKYHEKKS